MWRLWSLFPYQSSVIKRNHNKAGNLETNHFWKTSLTDQVSSYLTYIVYGFISMKNGVWKYCMQFILLNEIIMKACISINSINRIDFIPTSFAFNCQDVLNQSTFTRAIRKITSDNFWFSICNSIEKRYTFIGTWHMTEMSINLRKYHDFY